MGNWNISIRGVGPHHNGSANDADVIAQEFFSRLRDGGHSIASATITAGGETDLAPADGRPGTPGSRGYDAYGETAAWETFDGRPMPTWADLSKTEAGIETQRRWEVAAGAITGRR